METEFSIFFKLILNDHGQNQYSMKAQDGNSGKFSHFAKTF